MNIGMKAYASIFLVLSALPLVNAQIIIENNYSNFEIESNNLTYKLILSHMRPGKCAIITTPPFVSDDLTVYWFKITSREDDILITESEQVPISSIITDGSACSEIKSTFQGPLVLIRSLSIVFLIAVIIIVFVSFCQERSTKRF